MTTALSELEASFSSLEASLSSPSSPPPTYSRVVEEMEKIEAPLEYAWGVVNHLMGVRNGEPLRAAHAAIQPRVIETTTKLSQSYQVYSALETILSTGGEGENVGEGEVLDGVQRRVLSASLKAMKLSGVGLEGEEKERYNANRLQLAELSTQFGNHLLDATKAYSLTLTQKGEVEGLPPSALEAAAARAAGEGEKGSAEEGPWKLGLDIPSYLPAMKNLKNREVRRGRGREGGRGMVEAPAA